MGGKKKKVCYLFSAITTMVIKTLFSMVHEIYDAMNGGYIQHVDPHAKVYFYLGDPC